MGRAAASPRKRSNAWFRCISCPDTRYPLNQVVYECARCGGLLEVAHDMQALRQRSGAGWMAVFDQRYMRTTYPYGSGVWGKKEMVCPEVEDALVVSMYEGGSNLFWAYRLGRELGRDDRWSSSAATATPDPSRTWA